jgi:hypothetical protein
VIRRIDRRRETAIHSSGEVAESQVFHATALHLLIEYGVNVSTYLEPQALLSLQPDEATESIQLECLWTVLGLAKGLERSFHN